MIRFDFNLENPRFAPREKPILGTILSGVGSLLGLGAGIASQKAANDTNLQIARETNAQNYKQFQEQLGFTREMWNAQNEYNSPSAQMQRYREAGINPYLVMNGGATNGNAQAVSTPSANPAVNPSPIQPLITPEVGQQAIGNVLDNVGRYIDLQTRDLKNLSQIANSTEDTNLKKSLREQVDTSVTQSREMFGDVKSLLGEQVYNMQQQNADFAFKRNLMQIEADLMRSNIRVNDQQASLIKKNVDYFLENLNATILNSHANWLSSQAAVNQVNLAVRQFVSDPQNTWFENLHPSQKKSVLDLVRSQYVKGITREVKKLTYEGENYDWFGSNYFRVLKSLRQTLTSIAPIMGESETITNSSGEWLKKTKKPVF